MTYYIFRGSGRYDPELVQKVKDINDDTIEVRSVGFLRNGRIDTGGHISRHTKYLKTADLEDYG